MNCPDCHSTLEETDFKGIAIHECPRCRGRWFDRGELRKAKEHTDEDIRWLDFDPFGKSPDAFHVVSKGKPCPVCDEPMLSLAYENSAVVIGRCEKCRGIWLGHGEFEKMISYLEELVSRESAGEYVRDSFKQFLEIANGSEDFGSELKDFLVVLKLLRLRLGVEHPTLAKTINKIYQYLPFM